MEKMIIGEYKMYLREIGLYIKYTEKQEVIRKIMIEHNCTYEEAIKIDYNENWKWSIIRRFELETRCIASMFERLLGNFKNKDCAKINIKFFENTIQEGVSTCLKICTIQYKLNYNEFFLKSDEEKKKITLNIIRECIIKIAKEKEWDYTPFEEVFNKIIELEYNNCWTSKRKVKSPDKLYTGEIYFEHTIREVDIYLVIRNKKKEVVKKQLIITEIPLEYAYISHLGEIAWVSDTKFQMSNMANDKVWSISL